MQTRFLRDRLQRCRGELSQIISMARELEQAEEQHAGSGVMRPGWQQGGRYGGRADTFTASANFGRHESQAVTLLARMRQAADRCAATLSEVEREVDILTGSQNASGFQSSDRWERGASYGTYRDRSAWSAGQWNVPIPAGGSAQSEGYARQPSWGAGAYGGRSTREFGISRYGRDTGGETARGPGFFRPADQFSSRGTVAASQQGGYDYDYASARGGWNGRQSWSAERPLTSAGAASGRY